jgi:CDP-diacylglycerol--serine O-phosphatidyltransferase
LSGDAKYTGLAIDNNSIFLVFLFMFADYFSQPTFAIMLAVAGLCLATLNVSQIKTPKLSGNPVNVVLLATYTLAVTAIYGRNLL